jgi:hypothetical protein
LKADQKFVWKEEQQKALDEIMHYLITPPVWVPPQKHKLFKLYLSADERAIGLALIQEFEGKEHAIYFVPSKGYVFACIFFVFFLYQAKMI